MIFNMYQFTVLYEYVHNSRGAQKMPFHSHLHCL